MAAAALAMLACCRRGLGAVKDDARQGAQHGAAAEVPRHPALRSGAHRRRGGAEELENPTELQFLGPTPENSVAGQIEIVTNATTQGVNAIMISNNSGDQIVPAAKAAKAKGIKVVTWDSPIPSAEGEDVFVAQVDFTETGKVMADMALKILGPTAASSPSSRPRPTPPTRTPGSRPSKKASRIRNTPSSSRSASSTATTSPS